MLSRLSQKMLPGHGFHYKTNGFFAFWQFWTDLGLVIDSALCLSQKMLPGHSFHYKTNGFLAFWPFWTDLGLVIDSGRSLITENDSRAVFITKPMVSLHLGRCRGGEGTVKLPH